VNANRAQSGPHRNGEVVRQRSRSGRCLKNHVPRS
jgi:hypothetical protein